MAGLKVVGVAAAGSPHCTAGEKVRLRAGAGENISTLITLWWRVLTKPGRGPSPQLYAARQADWRGIGSNLPPPSSPAHHWLLDSTPHQFKLRVKQIKQESSKSSQVKSSKKL